MPRRGGGGRRGGDYNGGRSLPAGGSQNARQGSGRGGGGDGGLSRGRGRGRGRGRPRGPTELHIPRLSETAEAESTIEKLLRRLRLARIDEGDGDAAAAAAASSSLVASKGSSGVDGGTNNNNRSSSSARVSASSSLSVKKLVKRDKKAAAAEASSSLQRPVHPPGGSVRVEIAVGKNGKAAGGPKATIMLKRASDIEALLKMAKNKLKLKKPATAVLIHNGTTHDIKHTLSLENGDTLLVSVGEPGGGKSRGGGGDGHHKQRKEKQQKLGEKEEEEGKEEEVGKRGKEASASDTLGSGGARAASALWPVPTIPLTAYCSGGSGGSGKGKSTGKDPFKRKSLPAHAQREEVLATVAVGRVTIISGETGCGKTTQVPQYLLEEAAAVLTATATASCSSSAKSVSNAANVNVWCTQPRRLSAVGVAQRVAQERGESVGQSVGYIVRADRRSSSATRLTYCTVGVLLRRLQDDPNLHGITHVVVDEVHERSADVDFLLLGLRRLLMADGTRSDLRVILMSATLDAETLGSYFAPIEPQRDALRIPGRTFPVTQLHLEDAIALALPLGVKPPPAPLNASSEAAAGGDVMSDLKQLNRVQVGPGAGPLSPLLRDAAAAAAAAAAAPGGPMVVGTGPPYTKAVLAALGAAPETAWAGDATLISALVGLACGSDGGPLSDCIKGSGGSGGSGGDGKSITGAVLVFLPGIDAIGRVRRALESGTIAARLCLHILHSSVPPDALREAFKPAPRGMCKVVLATNIAETGVTLPDVTLVIDTGREKVTQFDPQRNLTALEERWVSLAGARQRAGRAGRVRPGVCIHLFSSLAAAHVLKAQPTPEVQRVSMQNLVLKTLALGYGEPRGALGQLPNPPSEAVIVRAVNALEAMGAITPATVESLGAPVLSTFGQALARLPTDARLGMLCLYGVLMRCLDPILTVAAALAGRPIFSSTPDDRAVVNASRRAFDAGAWSDHMVIIRAYEGWRAAKRGGGGWRAAVKYCHKHRLVHSALESIDVDRRQLLRNLVDMGLVPVSPRGEGGGDTSRSVSEQEDLDAYSGDTGLVRAVLCAGLFPQVVRLQTVPRGGGGGDTRVNFWAKNEEMPTMVAAHPSSVCAGVPRLPRAWAVYSEQLKTSRTFVRNISVVHPHALLLFGGPVAYDHSAGLLRVGSDGWVSFHATPESGVLFKLLRRMLDKVLAARLQSPARKKSVAETGKLGDIAREAIAAVVELCRGL